MNFKRIKSLLIILLCNIFLFGFYACSQKKKNTFVLSGTIKGEKPVENVALKYTIDTLTVYDTVSVKDGKFTFTGHITEPVSASIDLVNRLIWLEPQKMSIEINTDKSSYTLSGSKTHDEQESFYRQTDSLSNVYRLSTEKLTALKSEAERTKDKTLQKRLLNIYDSLKNAFAQNRPDAIKIQKEFIKSHPSSYFSAVLLFPLNSSEIIPLDTVIDLYGRMDAKVQQSDFGKHINTDIGLLKQNRIGALAPDFEAEDPFHKRTIKLSDFRGKVVLMDFWAPWCGPCRRGFKPLKLMYEANHNKGFEVIAIYADKKEEKNFWEKAIQEDKIEAWHHVRIANNMLQGKQTSADIRSKYYVQAIPRKMLIDQNGKIVKYWVGTSPEIEKDIEETILKLLAK